MFYCRRRTLATVAIKFMALAFCIGVQTINARSNQEHWTSRSTLAPHDTGHAQTTSANPTVTVSSLASFARKFWTTMANMASTTDNRLKRDNLVVTTPSTNGNINRDFITTPIIHLSNNDTRPATLVTEPSEPFGHNNNGLRETLSTENDAFIQEFPRGPLRKTRPTAYRRNRNNYYPSTFIPTSIPKVVRDNDATDVTNDFRRDRDSNTGAARSGRLIQGDSRSPSSSSLSSGTVTNETPRELDLKSTTLCNDTTVGSTTSRQRGEKSAQSSGTLASDVTWPPPPPKFLKEDFSVGITDNNNNNNHHHKPYHPHHQADGGEPHLGQLFTSESPIYSPPDLDKDFEVIPGIASPAVSTSTTSESLLSKDYLHASKQRNFTPSKLTSAKNKLSTTTTNLSSATRSNNNKDVPEIETTTKNVEVELSDLFDQEIIDNKTLLASSMFKLSSILTASMLTDGATGAATNDSSSGSRAAATTTSPTSIDDETSTSDFDFSTLFTSESLNGGSTSSIPPIAKHSSSTMSPFSTTLQSSDLAGEDFPPTIVNKKNRTSPLSSIKSPPSNRLASLMATGVANPFVVHDFDDIGDNVGGGSVDDFELVGEGFLPQFEEAGLVDGTREQPSFKTLNRFSAQIRAPVKNSSEEPGECLFNVTDQFRLCDWTFDSESSVHWNFGLGETAFMSGGPTLDSNGQTEGGYAFMDTSCGLQGSSNEIQRGSFESPLMSKTAPHGRCFTFWYNMGGLSADRLRVLLIPEEQFHAIGQVASRMPSFTTLWERKDSTNGTWLKGEVLYTFSKEHRLIFEGFARSGSDPRRKFQGYLAVDDLVMDSDSCKAFCTFEGVLCEWENDESNDEFDWELARGSDSHLTGPVRDHGDGPEGGFMFIDTAFPRRPGDIARLRSPELPSTEDGPVCFRFWTHMFGSGIGTLRVVLVDSTDEKNVIWEVSGESGNSWHMAQVTVASSNTFRLSLEGMVGRNALGRIAIDDLSFGPGPCPSSPQSALPLRGDCTFESDECGWVNAGSGDHYDWLRTSSGLPLLPGQGPNSGYRPPEPLSDHTTGLSSGFFLTMERSTIPPRGGDQAYVVGPTLQGTTGNNRCFSFWGYMHERSVDSAGPGLGSLRVYLRVGTSSILRPIWRLINYEHPDWFFAQAPINTNDKFQVVIGGTWGSTRQGAISVDDFTFFEGNCSVIPAEAEVIPGECTFDTNMCEWNSGLNRSRELSTWQLATSVRRPSNLDDHTYRATAGYVFFDIFSQQPHVVRLESPEITADNETSFSSTKTKISSADDSNSLDAADDDDDDTVDTEHCLTFWFAPFGSSRNTFLRILQRDSASSNETQVWEVTTANFQTFRTEWVYGQVALNTTYTHKIIFEGSSNNGGFALDDVMFVPGPCQSRPDNSA